MRGGLPISPPSISSTPVAPTPVAPTPSGGPFPSWHKGQLLLSTNPAYQVDKVGLVLSAMTLVKDAVSIYLMKTEPTALYTQDLLCAQPAYQSKHHTHNVIA